MNMRAQAELTDGQAIYHTAEQALAGDVELVGAQAPSGRRRHRSGLPSSKSPALTVLSPAPSPSSGSRGTVKSSS